MSIRGVSKNLRFWEGLQAFGQTGRLKGSGQLLGLDIGSRAIKLVQLDQRGGTYCLHAWGLKKLPGGVIVEGTKRDENEVITAIRALINECRIKDKHVALSLSGSSALVKRVHIPSMTVEEIEEYLTWEADQFIPFDLAEVYLDFHLLPPVSQAVNPTREHVILLVVAKREVVDERTALVKKAGLSPSVIDIDGFCLSNMYTQLCTQDSEGPVMLVDIGASRLNMTVVNQGTAILVRDALLGGERYEQILQTANGYSSKQIEHKLFSPKEHMSVLFVEVHAEMVREVKRTLHYLSEIEEDAKVTKLYLCGGYANVMGLLPALRDHLSLPVEILNPLRGIKWTPRYGGNESLGEMGHMAAVGLGLALRRVGDR